MNNMPTPEQLMSCQLSVMSDLEKESSFILRVITPENFIF